MLSFNCGCSLVQWALPGSKSSENPPPFHCIFRNLASPPSPMSSCDYLSSFGLSELKAPDLRPPATLSSSSSPSLTLLSSSPSPSSLYLAVKVRTLINTFRKRVKSRPQTSRKKFGDRSFCRDLEREAYSEIDRYLGRTQRRARNRKSREGATRAFTTSNTFATDAPCGTTDIKRYAILSIPFRTIADVTIDQYTSSITSPALMSLH